MITTIEIPYDMSLEDAVEKYSNALEKIGVQVKDVSDPDGVSVRLELSILDRDGGIAVPPVAPGLPIDDPYRNMAIDALSCLSHDMDTSFEELSFKSVQLDRLADGFRRMVAAGCAVTLDEISEIVCGESSEVHNKFGGFDGFNVVSDTLTEIWYAS